MDIIQPIIKWVGGKTQILEEVLDKFPCDIENYYEPFLGGGSVLLGVLSYMKADKIRIRGNIYASDINANLIGLYVNIKQRPSIVIEEVKKLKEEFSMCKGIEVNRMPKTLQEAMTSQESYYYWVRSMFNALSKEQRMTPIASAMFIFLNKTCFRGIYREGPNGFNVPFGHYKNPCIISEGHIYKVSELIQRVVFITASFTETLENIRTGDFVYLDPPYVPENETSFVSYTANGFSNDSHDTLFRKCRDMHNNNIKFVMSNADVPFVKSAFPSPVYRTVVISCRRAINSKNPGAKANEVLIAN